MKSRAPLAEIALLHDPGHSRAERPFALILKANGTALSIGLNRGQGSGTYDGKISVSEFQGLAQFLQKNHFEEFTPVYGSSAEGTASDFLSIVLAGKRQVTVYRHLISPQEEATRPPAALLQGVQRIQQLTRKQSWRKLSDNCQIPHEFRKLSPLSVLK